MWTTNDNDFKRCNDIYNSLNDKRNCILKLNNDLLYDKKETIILPFQPDLKFIHKILQKIKPMSNKMKSVLWRSYKLGISLSKIKTGTCSNKIKEFQWKCINGILC